MADSGRWRVLGDTLIRAVDPLRTYANGGIVASRMNAFILLPVLVFFACCVAQLWVVTALSSTLERRHPAVYAKMRGVFFQNRLVWFAWTRKDRSLGDPLLTRRAVRLQLLSTVSLCSWLAILCGMLLVRH